MQCGSQGAGPLVLPIKLKGNSCTDLLSDLQAATAANKQGKGQNASLLLGKCPDLENVEASRTCPDAAHLFLNPFLLKETTS